MPEWMLTYEEPVLAPKDDGQQVEWCELMFRFSADTAEGARETVRLFIKEPRVEVGGEKYFRKQIKLTKRSMSLMR